MSLLRRLLAQLHVGQVEMARAEEDGTRREEANLRAEDGFVPASQVKSRGVMRIY